MKKTLEFKEIKDFANYVAMHLFEAEPEMADNHSVHVQEVTKNNGTVLTGVVIKTEGCNIAPTLYVDKAFEQYQNDDTSIDVIITSLLRRYKESVPSSEVNTDFFTDFDKAKEHLSMKLVNAEKNSKLLTEVPHYNCGDLALIFQVVLDDQNIEELGRATVTVRNEHLKMWDIGTATLFNHARACMAENEPVQIRSMIEVMLGIMGDDIPEEMMLESMNPAMFVLSNKQNLNGAAGIVFTDELQRFADEHDSNLFILPSSIHELLLIADDGNMEVKQLEAMVREVNANQVAADEQLSDTVYYYDRCMRSLMFASTREIIEVKAA